VRNITNVQNRRTKEPMNHFYVDRQTSDNNKDLYDITAIQNKLTEIEPSQSTKPQIQQCLRCQLYGHTRKYCNMPYKSVTCGGHHNSTLCTKPKDSPAKCALCGGPHPANCKGCEQYRSTLKGHNPHRIPLTHRTPPPQHEDFPPFPPVPTSNIPQPSWQQRTQRSYADVLDSNKPTTEENTSILKTFLDEFRGLISQLIQQNGIIIHMLTTIINNHR